jgi:hypothetical protein
MVQPPAQPARLEVILLPVLQRACHVKQAACRPLVHHHVWSVRLGNIQKLEHHLAQVVLLELIRMPGHHLALLV